MIKERSLFLLIFWLLITKSLAQNIESLCNTDIRHFTKREYNGQYQNWNLAQHTQTKFMYVANSKGLLEYDGSNWKAYKYAQNQKIRSVAVDASGNIYTGALGEFGIWQRNATGELTYHSLKKEISDPSFTQEEIWNILPTKQGVLFQSFAFMYRYQNKKIKKLNVPGNILFVYEVRGRFFLEILDKGLFEMKEDRFEFIRGSEFLQKESVHTVLPIRENGLLIGTNKGIYVYENQHFSEFNNATNQFILQNQLNCGLQIDSERYAFGTILNGIIITNKKGQIIQQINQKKGLQNNTILAMTKDTEGNLWAGLDKGIDLILLNSPLKYFTDYDGHLGTVYDVALFKNCLYIGTNQGLFVNHLKPDSHFELVSKTQGQVWNLEILDKQLLCGHNNGTFVIEGRNAQLISNITGGWAMQKLKNKPNMMIQSTYTQLCIYRKDANGKWIFDHAIQGFSGPVRQLEQDDAGNIWVNKTTNEVTRLKISDDFKEVVQRVKFDANTIGAVSENLAKINDKIILTTKKSILEYQPITQKFIESSSLQKLTNNQQINKVFQVNRNNFFALETDGSLQFVSNQQKPIFIPIQKDLWVDDYENLVALDSSNILLCTENGFALMPNSIHGLFTKNITPKTIFRTVSIVDFPDKSVTINKSISDDIFTLNYDQNSVVISFSTPQFTHQIQYSYWLENSSKGWSSWQNIYQKEFNDLSPNKYILHVKSSLNDEESTFVFLIKQPWYWNGWSRFFYLLIAISFAGFFYWFHIHKIELQQENLRRKHEKKLKRQLEQSENAIMQIKNEQLEKDLIRKSEELANSTMVLIKKNELLGEIKKETNNLPKQVKNRSFEENYVYKKILYLVDSNIATDQDWQLFEANFKEVHEEFLEKLLEKYGHLTPSDLKLAAYLRMNLSTKEIAQLFNITNRSVELKRYRLRKKLKLNTDVNLGEFMMKFRVMQ